MSNKFEVSECFKCTVAISDTFEVYRSFEVNEAGGRATVSEVQDV